VAPGSVAFAAIPLAAILAVAGVLFARGLDQPPSFDEGVYAAQTDALLHGQRLGTDVFAAQPPVFYWLLFAAGKLGGAGIDQLRLAVLALALLGLVAAFAIGRAAAGLPGGLAAAAVLAVAPPYPSWAAQVSADLPGLVLALCALALLVTLPESRRRRWMQLAAAGVLVAAAESVKLDAFVLLVPVVWLVYRRRIFPAELAVVVAAACVALGIEAAVLAGSLPDVWRGAVSYHLAARSTDSLGDNLDQLRAFFHPRQPFTWLVAAGLVAAAWGRPRLRLPLGGFWLAALAAALFLLWHRPLRDNHMVLLAIALAVPAAATLAAPLRRSAVASAAAALLVGLVLVGGYAQETRRAERNAGPLPADLRWAADRVAAATSPDELVVSDEPVVPVAAGRRMPGDVIDTAVLRFDSGYLDDAEVLRAIEANDVRVVVAGRAFLQRPGLVRALERRFPSASTRGGVTVYERG